MLNHKRALIFLLFICFTAIFACAGRSYLIIDYRLPTASQNLSGQSVYLDIKDLRENTEILSPTAAAEFDGFRGRYNLVLLDNQGGGRIEAGQFDLKGLFKEAFRERLRELGVKVVDEKQNWVPTFEITLKKMRVDLLDRKWQATVSYEASLNRDDQLIAREIVSGEAQRLKIIGRKGADTVLSEIFSDLINRLDIVALFQQAQLTAS